MVSKEDLYAMIPINEKLPTELYFAMLSKLIEVIEQNNKISPELADTLRKEVNGLLYKQLHDYVVSYLRKHYPSYLGTQDAWNELWNTCWSHIFKAFPKYNGKYSLTTFVNCYIKAGAKEQIAFWMNKSMYQSMVWIKLRSTMELLRLESINNENLEQISAKSGLSRGQIIHSLQDEIASKKNYLPE